MRDDDTRLIVNLTVPQAHYEMTMKAIEAGKHVYTEKPLALTRKDAAFMIDAAAKKGVRLGSAPDTFMSAPFQTAKKLIAENTIGDIVGVNAVCPMRGNEFWRPDADFFYKKGAGPIWDMAPYYLNLMISLFGSFRSVTSVGRITWKQRTYEYEARKGDKIDVEVPTHTVALFELENGVIFNFTNSFDTYRSASPYIEIFGETGTLILPFPNHYTGDVLLSKRGGDFEVIEQLTGYEGFMRSAGIADISACLDNGKSHLASAEMAYHVTDAMCAWEEAMEKGCTIKIESRCETPEGMWQRESLK
jgi:predicted dehydrogenase